MTVLRVSRTFLSDRCVLHSAPARCRSGGTRRSPRRAATN